MATAEMITAEENALAIATKGFVIPAKPEILINLENLLAGDEVNVADVAKLISSDVGLSSLILKTINSPFYGMSASIGDIRQAVMLLGIQVIKAVMTGALLRQSYVQKSCISMERFWDTAGDIANSMNFISHLLKERVVIDNLYTLGLFCDCGIPAFAIRYPDYREVLIEANSGDELLVDLENRKYHSNHAIVGYYLANAWGLPKEVCHVILNHHDVHFLDKITGSADQYYYAALKLSENIINKNRRFQEITEWSVCKFRVYDLLGITESDALDLEEDIMDHLTH
ncbi:HDOD domain-containing protein [Gynuella sunshinyii]|uniref:Putative signal transduction protein n=1 Tax=Gynuella sunshinyii YC6258 TaxID=1445510 RepID=A0A0C5W221_9GAMM|nr:HDOD domain-containing protein [Gynuella sunshinyii]AJQ96709.1 putative signal transduction protein [Gynuella sunshinyii YC6258]